MKFHGFYNIYSSPSKIVRVNTNDEYDSYDSTYERPDSPVTSEGYDPNKYIYSQSSSDDSSTISDDEFFKDFIEEKQDYDQRATQEFICLRSACAQRFTSELALQLHQELYHTQIPLVYIEPENPVKLKAYKRTKISTSSPHTLTNSKFDGENHVAHKVQNRENHRLNAYKCFIPSCDKAFATAEKLKLHHTSHAIRKSYICTVPECKKSLSSMHCFKRHYTNVHNIKNPYVCKEIGCERRFERFMDLSSHYKFDHKQPLIVRSAHQVGESSRRMDFRESDLGLTETDCLNISDAGYACDIKGCNLKFRIRRLLTLHKNTSH
ncbi:18005_t:CDS:2 [Acaulospora morrowiae]|uniref:18005_t:CDS:1 n=1 Tax=Acaulospora morrowiae TaxID=94023 RepID=A0A9N9FNH2_9GLOM|nr:18005_t:CDS:2 [Acaulospora morrowiae]